MTIYYSNPGTARRRRGVSRRPPHRVSSSLAPGPHHGAMHPACTARATIAHATRERGHPPPLPDPLLPIEMRRRAAQENGSYRSAWLLAHKLGGAACVPPPPFGGRGTGGGGPIVCAPLSRTRDPICCAHDPTGRRARAASQASALCPAESHLSHLIEPLNPGKSRLENCVFPRASSTLACAHLVEQGERTALEGFLMLPGVRCARTDPALQSPRRCGLRRAVRPPERRNGRSPSANGRGAVEVRERSLQSETRLMH